MAYSYRNNINQVIGPGTLVCDPRRGVVLVTSVTPSTEEVRHYTKNPLVVKVGDRDFDAVIPYNSVRVQGLIPKLDYKFSNNGKSLSALVLRIGRYNRKIYNNQPALTAVSPDWDIYENPVPPGNIQGHHWLSLRKPSYNHFTGIDALRTIKQPVSVMRERVFQATKDWFTSSLASIKAGENVSTKRKIIPID